MDIITLSNEKGGVGKSTLAVTIAMGLAHRGKEVMLVDADAQGNATERCGIRMKPGLYDLLVRDANWEDVTERVDPQRYGGGGALHVMPSNVETRNIATSISDVGLFSSRLDELRSTSIEVVIIDTSPTPSLLHGTINVATDYIIYPTTCTIDSFRGLGFSIQHRRGADMIRNDELKLPSIKMMGIVPTLYRHGTVEQEVNLKALTKQFGGLVWKPMPLRTIWTETESQRKAVWALDANHDAARDAYELIDMVEGKLKHDAAQAR